MPGQSENCRQFTASPAAFLAGLFLIELIQGRLRGLVLRHLVTELPFAGYPVTIAVHSGVGAVTDEIGGFSAGAHLGAMGAAIATEAF